LLDVLLDLVGMGATVNKDFIDTSVGKELEGVFNQGSVGQRKQTLRFLDVVRLVFKVGYVREGVQA
jgi:hypothetical protein